MGNLESGTRQLLLVSTVSIICAILYPYLRLHLVQSGIHTVCTMWYRRGPKSTINSPALLNGTNVECHNYIWIEHCTVQVHFNAQCWIVCLVNLHKCWCIWYDWAIQGCKYNCWRWTNTQGLPQMCQESQNPKFTWISPTTRKLSASQSSYSWHILYAVRATPVNTVVMWIFCSPAVNRTNYTCNTARVDLSHTGVPKPISIIEYF